MSTVGWTGKVPTDSPSMRRLCEPVGVYVPTVEEMIRNVFRYAEQKVGVVYLHLAYGMDSFYIGCSEDYQIRKNATDKKRFVSTKPMLLLLTSNIFAVEKAISDAVGAKNSIVRQLDDETYTEFYDRVIAAFTVFEEYSIRKMTANYARFISKQQFRDWSKNIYRMENDKYLYLDNPIVEELDEDTHWHWGYKSYYEVTNRRYKNYLRIPSYMRIKHHKLTLHQMKKEKLLENGTYD